MPRGIGAGRALALDGLGLLDAVLISSFTMDEQLDLSLRARGRGALGVTQLVRMVRETLEFHLDECWVVGEVSNARLAPSNHFYFTLKDAQCSISVVMFRAAYRKLRFDVSDGMEVMVRGRVNLYEARGTLQFYAEEMEPRGLGALQIAFEQLKRRLGAEGLFDAARKRPLPFLPHTVGLVTALRGAGLQDMLTVLLGRCPNLHILVRPARVQGSGSALEIADALDDLNRDGRAEVIIVGRGGGSLEDLWAFNEEAVARAIHRSAIPVVSAVGHEIDYTIADFAADCRAPTPTAAAQMVVPDKGDLKRRLNETGAALNGAMNSALASHRRQVGHLGLRLRDPRGAMRQARQRLDEASAGLARGISMRLGESHRRARELAGRLRPPAALMREIRRATGRLTFHLAQTMGARARQVGLGVAHCSERLRETALRVLIQRRRVEIAALVERLDAAASAAVERKSRELSALSLRLDSLSPLKVLGRGYAVVLNTRDGRAVVDAEQVALGDELEVRLKRGRLRARTTAREI
jgi:exodeoxyribonuclease VII large subunit